MRTITLRLITEETKHLEKLQSLIIKMENKLILPNNSKTLYNIIIPSTIQTISLISKAKHLMWLIAKLSMNSLQLIRLRIQTELFKALLLEDPTLTLTTMRLNIPLNGQPMSKEERLK